MRMRSVSCVCTIAAVAGSATICFASGVLLPLWQGPQPSGILDIGHITNPTTLSAFVRAGQSNQCPDGSFQTEYRVVDLRDGTIAATWLEPCPAGAGPLVPWFGKYLYDVDGDGLDEVLIRQPTYSLVFCLKFDVATQTLTPGGPPADSIRVGALRAFPNPAKRAATITFNLLRPETAKLEIFDVTGRSVKHISVHATKSGEQSVIWNGTDESERPVASGTYFYSVTTSAGNATRKVVLLY